MDAALITIFQIHLEEGPALPSKQQLRVFAPAPSGFRKALQRSGHAGRERLENVSAFIQKLNFRNLRTQQSQRSSGASDGNNMKVSGARARFQYPTDNTLFHSKKKRGIKFFLTIIKGKVILLSAIL